MMSLNKKNNLFVLKVDNNHNVINIFLSYSNINHQMAHLYEHLIYRELYKDLSIKEKKCTTGAGIIHIKFKSNKEYLNTDFLLSILRLDNLDKKDFDLEKERLIGEMKETLIDNNKVFYQFLQYRVYNYAKLKNLIKKIKKISLLEIRNFAKITISNNIILILASPGFNKKNIQYKQINDVFKKQVLSENSKIRTIKINRKTDLNYLGAYYQIPIKNSLEAYYLSLIANLIGDCLNNTLISNGVAYQIKSGLYKDYDHSLWWGFGLFGQPDKLNKFFKTSQTMIKNFVLEKEKFNLEKDKLIGVLKNLKRDKILQIEDVVWQMIEWNNYLSLEEEIKSIKSLEMKELSFWWQKKIKSAEIYKIINH